MKSNELSFEVPDHLIAQHPPEKRGTARLMVVDRGSGAIVHGSMGDLVDHLPTDAMVVFNDTRVRKARLHAGTASGGAQEILFLRCVQGRTWEAMSRPARRIRPGATFALPGNVSATVLSAPSAGESLIRLELDHDVDDAYFESYGHVPLPPYIRRPDESGDAERYQTVYAANEGSVAAPTAGLHFTPNLIEGLHSRGIAIRYVTLHVGIGTFLPIRSGDLEDHVMHAEEYSVSAECARDINEARQKGRPIVAVGTTVVRTLESAFDGGVIRSGRRETDLFIRPGYRFAVVDHLFTNFHTPRSTLIAMVGAFAGLDTIKAAYAEAVEKEYRFFSYGDAMLLL